MLDFQRIKRLSSRNLVIFGAISLFLLFGLVLKLEELLFRNFDDDLTKDGCRWFGSGPLCRGSICPSGFDLIRHNQTTECDFDKNATCDNSLAFTSYGARCLTGQKSFCCRTTEDRKTSWIGVWVSTVTGNMLICSHLKPEYYHIGIVLIFVLIASPMIIMYRVADLYIACMRRETKIVGRTAMLFSHRPNELLIKGDPDVWFRKVYNY